MIRMGDGHKSHILPKHRNNHGQVTLFLDQRNNSLFRDLNSLFR
jgi:hypothetical protein